MTTEQKTPFNVAIDVPFVFLINRVSVKDITVRRVKQLSPNAKINGPLKSISFMNAEYRLFSLHWENGQKYFSSVNAGRMSLKICCLLVLQELSGK